MVLSSTALIRNSPPCFRSVILSSNFASRLLQQPISTYPMFPSNPSEFVRFRRSFSRQSCPISSNSGRLSLYKGLGGSLLRFKDLSMDCVRVSASTDSGSDGIGGNGGRSGGGGGGGCGGDGDSNFNRSLFSWYLDLLAEFPVMTKAVTSALLTFIGDLICQLAIDKVPSLDNKRTILFTFLGMVLVGPTLHFWYLYLSKLITRPGTSGALMRLLLDQFLFSPTFIGVFLSALVTLEGRPSEVVPKLKQEWFSSVLANWQLWIPFQYFNFRFVPQQFQVLAANFVSLIWNVILSYKAHREVVQK